MLSLSLATCLLGHSNVLSSFRSVNTSTGVWNCELLSTQPPTAQRTDRSYRRGPITSNTPTFNSIIKSKLATGIWCEPKLELITGRVQKWAEAAKVDTVRVPGHQYNSPRSQIPTGARTQPNEKVFYHLHGGAYISGSASSCSQSPQDNWRI
jgi:acetyl esterase/lipase